MTILIGYCVSRHEVYSPVIFATFTRVYDHYGKNIRIAGDPNPFRVKPSFDQDLVRLVAQEPFRVDIHEGWFSSELSYWGVDQRQPLLTPGSRKHIELEAPIRIEARILHDIFTDEGQKAFKELISVG